MAYYLLKILYAFILIPGNFIVAFFLSALSTKRFKTLFITLALLFYLASTQFVGTLLLAPLEAPFNHPPKETKVDAIVLLGAGHYLGSSNLPLTPNTTKRLLFALMLAKEKNLPILFNGFKEESQAARQSVQEINQKLSLNLAITTDHTYSKEFRIYFETRAQNTQQNAHYTKAFFTQNQIENPTIYLVTSASHMQRAKKVFEKEGITTLAAATDFHTREAFCYCFFFPSIEGLRLSSLALYEYLALLKESLH